MSDSRANNPNIDPADNDTLAGVIRFAFSQLMRNVDGMLPARVLAYDRTANRVQVEIMIAMVTTSGQQVSRAQIANIPVINIGGGGYILNFPLKPNDLGFIIANDRDISLFLQSMVESPPNTQRVKNFADSVFIPSILNGYTINGEDADNAVLQNLDGTVRISLGTDSVTISASANVTIDAPVTTVTGELVVEGLTRTQAGLAVSGIATGIYSAYFAAPLYAIGTSGASVAFADGVPPPAPP